MRTKQYNQYLEFMNYLENKELVNHRRELDQLVFCKNAQIRSRVAVFLLNYKDSYTESEIINEILNESKTLVYVCHRLICVKSFDKIIFMDSGKIAGIGSHDELFETNQEYKELYLSQAKEYLN